MEAFQKHLIFRIPGGPRDQDDRRGGLWIIPGNKCAFYCAIFAISEKNTILSENST